MADSIFTVQTPANPDEDDGTELTLGTRFVSAVDGTITAVRWFFPATPIVGAVNGRIYSWTSDATGVLLDSNDFVAPVPGAWNTTPVNVPITAGTPYVTAVHTPTPYVSTGGLFATSITNGNLTATADGPGTANGKFIDADAYPSLSFGSNGYFVDVVFEVSAVSVSVTGSGEIDAAFDVDVLKVASVTGAGEVDAAFDVDVFKAADVEVAVEVDAAFDVGAFKDLGVGLAQELDLAFPVTASGGAATVTTFNDGPCEVWPVIWPCPLNLSPEVMAVTGVALQAASDVLWVRSGRRFSLCSREMRPCRADCNDAGYTYDGWWAWPTYPQPRFYQGVWTNVVCGLCLDGCSCSRVSKVRLPVPVSEITSVIIDGVSLPASAYQLYDYRELIRQDGGEFPRCNDLSRPNGSVGTWSITAVYGEAVPVLGQMAVGELAVEFAKALACDTSCQLPAPVQQLTRQGVSMAFLDPNEVYASGRLGLRMSDLFLSTYNPDGLRAPARVYNIDNPFGRIPT